MSPETILHIADICQSTTLALSFCGYLPQWIKLIRTKCSKSISINSWLIWGLGNLLAWFYAFAQVYSLGTGKVLLITSSCSVLLNLSTTALIIYYNKSQKMLKPIEEIASLAEEAVVEISEVLPIPQEIEPIESDLGLEQPSAV